MSLPLPYPPAVAVDRRRSFPVSNRGKGRRALMVRAVPALAVSSTDVVVRPSADVVGRGSADISNGTISNIGNDSIEETAIVDRGDGPQLKRHRLNNMAPDEAMRI